MSSSSFTPELTLPEIQEISAKRASLRLAKPADCFFYRHIQPKTWHLIVQGLFCTVSLCLIAAYALFTRFYATSEVQGFGLADEATGFDKFSSLFVITIFLFRANALKKAPQFSRRVKFAMFSNAINLYMLAQVVLFLLLSLVVVLVASSFAIAEELEAFKRLSDMYQIGIIFDYLDLSANVFSIVFAFFVCRHFSRGAVK